MSQLHKYKPGSNMYDWCDYGWMPFVPHKCHHACDYCWAADLWPTSNAEIIRLPFPELGKGKTIYVADRCDLFNEEMDSRDIESVLRHCQKYPLNRYVFQTKNPERMYGYLSAMPQAMPGQSILGTTIETDDAALLAKHSKAPEPAQRALWIGSCHDAGFKTFLTIEPIMRFSLYGLVALIGVARPDFVNIGADSKGHQLPEPTGEEIQKLIDAIGELHIPIKIKSNLENITKPN